MYVNLSGGIICYKMRLNIFKKAIIIGLCSIAAVVVAFVMKMSSSPVMAVEVADIMPWEINMLIEVNDIRDKYGLPHLEWSYSSGDSSKVFTTTHSNSIYSDDELFAKYLISYWFNKDKSVFLSENIKYICVRTSLEEGVLTASLYFPEENQNPEGESVSPYYSAGHTENYNMADVINGK